MGEIAEDTIDGFKCSWCGVYFEKENGFPVACDSCWEEALDDAKKGKFKKSDVWRDKSGKVTMICGVQKSLEAEI
jgi:hypothetical protein